MGLPRGGCLVFRKAETPDDPRYATDNVFPLFRMYLDWTSTWPTYLTSTGPRLGLAYKESPPYAPFPAGVFKFRISRFHVFHFVRPITLPRKPLQPPKLAWPTEKGPIYAPFLAAKSAFTWWSCARGGRSGLRGGWTGGGKFWNCIIGYPKQNAQPYERIWIYFSKCYTCFPRMDTRWCQHTFILFVVNRDLLFYYDHSSFQSP